MRKTQRNKYLDDLGIPVESYGTNFITNKFDKRFRHWRKEQKKYGFDERECWDLDQTYAEWLYSHLKKYVEDSRGVVDLNYYEFEIFGEKLTQGEWIDRIIEYLEKALLLDNISDMVEKAELIRDATLIWAEIFQACWW